MCIRDSTITGGSMPYEIEWSNGSELFDLMDLAAGTYTPTITDANGCELIGQPITVDELEPLVLSTDISNVSCNRRSCRATIVIPCI